MALDKLIIRGAREHNLRSVDLEIPRDRAGGDHGAERQR